MTNAPQWLIEAGIPFTPNSRSIQKQMEPEVIHRLTRNQRMKNKRLTFDRLPDDENEKE